MNREVEPVGTNSHGGETHPAFALIGASRVTHGGGPHSGVVLFDSDIVHQHTVLIRIETATRKRDLHHDRIHGDKQVVEVELSEAQWASFVSSMNSSGVPATLRWTQEAGPLPELEYAPRLAQSMAEVKGAAERLIAEIRQARDAYEQAVADKAGAKVIKAARDKLHHAIENSGPNLAYAAKVMREDTENVVQKARADIEAMVSTEAHRLGLTPGTGQGLVELPILEGETVEAIEP